MSSARREKNEMAKKFKGIAVVSGLGLLAAYLLLSKDSSGSESLGDGGSLGGTDDNLPLNAIGGGSQAYPVFDGVLPQQQQQFVPIQSPNQPEQPLAGTPDGQSFFESIGGWPGLTLGAAGLIPSKVGDIGAKATKKIIGEPETKPKTVSVVKTSAEEAIEAAVKNEFPTTGLKSLTKRAGAIGVKTIPVLGLGAGIAYDIKYQDKNPGAAVLANLVGDLFGGIAGVGGSAVAPGVGTVAGAVGGQIAGESLIYGLTDDDKDLEVNVVTLDGNLTTPATVMSKQAKVPMSTVQSLSDLSQTKTAKNKGSSAIPTASDKKKAAAKLIRKVNAEADDKMSKAPKKKSGGSSKKKPATNMSKYIPKLNYTPAYFTPAG